MQFFPLFSSCWQKGMSCPTTSVMLTYNIERSKTNATPSFFSISTFVSFFFPHKSRTCKSVVFLLLCKAINYIYNNCILQLNNNNSLTIYQINFRVCSVTPEKLPWLSFWHLSTFYLVLEEDQYLHKSYNHYHKEILPAA